MIVVFYIIFVGCIFFVALVWIGAVFFIFRSLYLMQAVQGESIELEFQVVSGGALDVDYTLANPSGHIIERKSRVQDHLYEATASQTGDHRICLVRRGGGGDGW